MDRQTDGYGQTEAGRLMGGQAEREREREGDGLRGGGRGSCSEEERQRDNIYYFGLYVQAENVSYTHI